MKKSSQVDDGCVLYLSNRKKSSTTWSDFSKAGNNGTVNGATLARNGYSFDGTDDYISIPTTTKFEFGSGAYTALAWVYYPSTPSVEDFIFQLGLHIGGGHFWEIYIDNSNNLQMNLYNNAYNYQPISASTVSTGKWHHVAGIFTGTHAYVVLDTVAGTAINYSGNDFPTGQSLQIGRGSDSGTYYYLNGSIGEVRIYNRALSANEILNHYGKTRKFYGV